jgi:hypothetical protein
MAVSDFADLTRDPEPVIVGGQLWSSANLVAAVVNGLIEAVEPIAGAVTTYPAVYSGKQVSLLRQAMNLAGARDVALVPEPVAAAEWLEREHGPLQPGFVLVYDLGGTCLDVTVVRVGPDWGDHPMVGNPVRSYDFGGRPLGSMIARCAHGVAPGRSGSLSMTSIVDIDGLRTEHIRDSFDVVRACVRSTGLNLSDIERVLLVGGAARPAEVARTLAELGRPVVVSADPGQIVAAGAAHYAARTMAPAVTGKHFVPHPTVFSSAAVASAIAVSAVTVFGGPIDTELSPVLDRLPGIDIPADALLYEPSGAAELENLWRAGGAAFQSVAYNRPVSGLVIEPASRSTRFGPTIAESGSRSRSHQEPRSCCDTAQSGFGTYANPAQFLNPLPFGAAPALNLPRTYPVIPRISFPPNFPGTTPAPGAPAPGTTPAPGAPAPGTTPAPGAPAPGTTPAPGAPAPGTTPAPAPGAPAAPGTGTPASGATDTPSRGGTTDTPTSGGASGETSSGGAASGGSSAGATPGGATSDDGTSGGASYGGTSSGGSGDTSGGSGGVSTGGTSGGSGGVSSGGTSGGSGGVSSGGASGGSGGVSSGGASGGSGGASSGGSGGASSGGASSGGASAGTSPGGMSSGGAASGGALSGGAAAGGAFGGGASSSGPSSHGASGGVSSGGASSGHSGGAGGSGGFGGGARGR